MDTGIPGLAVRIRDACEHAGAPYDRLNHIILTHDDIEHIGSLGAYGQDAVDPIEIPADEPEAASIESGRPR